MTSQTLNELPLIPSKAEKSAQNPERDFDSKSEKPSHGFEPVNLTLGHRFIRYGRDNIQEIDELFAEVSIGAGEQKKPSEELAIGLKRSLPTQDNTTNDNKSCERRHRHHRNHDGENKRRHKKSKKSKKIQKTELPDGTFTENKK